MKDEADSQENNPCAVKPKFAKESTHWFPSLNIRETTKFIADKSFVQLIHLFLNCQGTMSPFEKAITTNFESDSSQRFVQFL